MRALLKLTIVELKLLLRDPITLIFTLALPLIMLIAMGEVFGQAPNDPTAFRGVGAMNYYTPAYLGLVMLAIATVALPVHLAGYRERGILRRFRASSLSIWSLFTAQAIVSLVLSIICGVLLVVPSMLAYDVQLPNSPGLLVIAFLLSALSLIAFGLFLGTVLPTARAAQGVGMPLFFIVFVLSGTAPPREVMTQGMQRVGESLPLWHVVTLLQDVWLGSGWNGAASLIVAGIMLLAGGISALILRKRY